MMASPTTMMTAASSTTTKTIVAYVVFATASIALLPVVSPFVPSSGGARFHGAGGFFSTTNKGLQQLQQQQKSAQQRRHRPLLRADTSTNTDDASTDASEEEKKPSDWWSSVTFHDASLPLEVRDDFPILSVSVGSSGGEGGDEGEESTADDQSKKPLIYLDSAATSHKPRAVTSALTQYYDTINSNVHRGAHSLSRAATEQYEAARDSIATFINAYSRNEIVFTAGATEAINLVASSYGLTHLQPGDEIILSEMEHHSNIVPWQLVSQKTGAVLKVVPVSNSTGCLDMDVFESLLNKNTKMITLQHVSNVLGCINPVDDIVRLARSKASPECKILLDACQSVPHMPVDVQTLGVDFLAASGHKMCGPTGIGFLWGKEDLLNDMPPYQGGGEMIDEVFMEESTYAPAPARFEAGTPAIAQAIGLGAAIQYLQNIGMERIYAYEVELADYLRKRLEDVQGIQVLGPPPGVKRAALVSFVSNVVHPSDLGTFLDMEGVAIRAGHHCCQPLHRSLGWSHSARASLYFYNTKEEIDAFIGHLEDTLKFFGSLGGSSDNVDGSGGVDDDFVPFV